MFDQSDLQARPVLFPITHISGSTSSSLNNRTVAPRLDTPAVHCAKTKALENQTLQAAKLFEALAEHSGTQFEFWSYPRTFTQERLPG